MHSFGFGSKIGRTGVEEMPNWGTENWQNVNLLVIRRLEMKGLIFINMVSFYHDCFLVLFISCFFFHLNLSYCPPLK